MIYEVLYAGHIQGIQEKHLLVIEICCFVKQQSLIICDLLFYGPCIYTGGDGSCDLNMIIKRYIAQLSLIC